ncbi:hypothetical protein DK846_05425 [Methanospirillum lacunae]|uniref:Uncharacterized protein n=1 Tax=Methanospirillum lacunae TaxID=668570 RepID=A0A2V2MY09_9EURY|nr:hypothetical protein DK846_05425 [Methanospirillum lacunae]
MNIQIIRLLILPHHSTSAQNVSHILTFIVRSARVMENIYSKLHPARISNSYTNNPFNSVSTTWDSLGWYL